MQAAVWIALADLAFRGFETFMTHARRDGATPEQIIAFRADKIERFDQAIATLEASEPPPIRQE